MKHEVLNLNFVQLKKLGFESTIVSKLKSEFKKIYPNIPDSILLGVTLSGLSSGLQYLFKVSLMRTEWPPAIPINIFFLGELPGGSGKTTLLNFFRDAFEDAASEVNSKLKLNHRKKFFNVGALDTFEGESAKTLLWHLKKHKKTVFVSASCDDEGLTGIAYPIKKGGGFSIFNESWLAEGTEDPQLVGPFGQRKVWGSICSLSSPGSLDKILGPSGIDGEVFLGRCLISREKGKNVSENYSGNVDNKNKIVKFLNNFFLKVFSMCSFQSFDFESSDEDFFWTKLKHLTFSSEALERLNKIEWHYKERSEQENVSNLLAYYQLKAILHVMKISAVLYTADALTKGIHFKEESDLIVPENYVEMALSLFQVFMNLRG